MHLKPAVSFLISTFFLVSCSNAKIADYMERSEFYQDNVLTAEAFEREDAENLTDEAMTELLSNLYGLKHLEAQNLYWDGEELQMDFHFSNDLSRSEIDGARSFVLNKFVLGQQSQYNISPYEIWMREDGKIRKIPIAKCQIFIQGELLLQDHYEDMTTKDGYENTSIFLPCREILDDWQELEEMVYKEDSEGKVRLQKAICNDSIFIQVCLKQLPMDSFIDQLEACVMEKAEKEQLDHSCIVLSMVQENGDVFSSVLDLNSDELQWRSEAKFNYH